MSPWEEVEKDPEFSTLAPQDKAALFDDWHKTTVEDFHKELDPEQIDSAGMRGFLASGQAKRRELLGEPMAPEQAVKEFDQSLQARSKAQQQTLNDYDELEKSRFALKDAAMTRGVTSSEDRGMPMSPRVTAILDKPQQEAQAKLDELSSRFTPETEQQAKEARQALRGERPAAVLGSDIYTDPSLVLDKEKYRQAIQSTNASPEAKLLALADFNTRRDEFAKKALSTFNTAGEAPKPYFFGAEKVLPEMTSFAKWESEQPAEVRSKPPEAKALDYLRTMQDRPGFQKIVSAIGTGTIQGGADVAGQGIGLAAMATGSDALAKKAGEVEKGSQSMSDVQKLEGDTIGTDVFDVGGVKANAATTLGGISRLGVGMAPAIGAGVLTGGSLPAAALAAGAQTAGSQFPTTYNAMIEQGKTPEEALSASRGAAVLSGGITAALTAMGGYNGVEALIRRGGMEAARSKLKSVLLTGPLKEIAEELPDEQASQIIEASLTNPDKPVSQVVDEFMAKAPDLALQVGLLGGAGEAFSKQGAPATPATPAEQQHTPVNSAGLGRTVAEVVAESDALAAKAHAQAVESGSPLMAEAIAKNAAAPTPEAQAGRTGNPAEPSDKTRAEATAEVATEASPEQEVKATTEQDSQDTTGTDPAEIHRKRNAETESLIVRDAEGDTDRAATKAKRDAAAKEAGMTRDEWEDVQAALNVKAKEDFFNSLNEGDTLEWIDANGKPATGKVEIQLDGKKVVRNTTEGSPGQDYLYDSRAGEFGMRADSLKVIPKGQKVSSPTTNAATPLEQGGSNQHAGESRTPAEGSISDVTTGKVADNKPLSTIDPSVQGVVTLQPEQLAALTPNPAEIEQAITDNQTPAREAMDLTTADPIMVIRQKDGTLMVAQGHHRLARALRDKVPLQVDIQNEVPTKSLAPARDATSQALDEAQQQASESLREAMNDGRGRFNGRNIDIIVSPSSRPDVMLQITRVSKTGEPQGHQDIKTEKDFEDAIADPDTLDVVLEHTRPDIGQGRVLKGFGVPKFRKPVQYKYRLRLRDVGLGTVPKGFILAEGRDVVYDRPLTRQEMQDFEIDPVGAELKQTTSTEAPLKSVSDRINESSLSPRTTFPTLVQDIKALTGNTASNLQEVADALLPEPMTRPTAEKIARRLMEDNAVQREAGAARERALERDLIGEEKAQRGDERPVSDDKAPVTQGDFVTWQDENGAMQEGVLTKVNAGRGSLGEHVSEVTLEDSQTVTVPRRELQPLMASNRGNPVQAARAEAIESLRGHLGKEVSVGVSAVDAINGAAELQGDVPGVQKAWVGTRAEFLADEGLRKAFPQVTQALLSKQSDRFEGLFSGGRAFVFTDQVGIYEADIESAAEQEDVSPGQAAVQRVITHEALVHRGFYALDKPTRQALLRWGEQNIYEGEMDAKAEEYGVGANWRSDVGSREWLMEEIMAKMIERLKAPPKSGPLKQLWDILASIWRKLTGRSREVTLKDIHDVAKLLRTALELAENNVNTRDGMPIRVEVVKPSMREGLLNWATNDVDDSIRNIRFENPNTGETETLGDLEREILGGLTEQQSAETVRWLQSIDNTSEEFNDAVADINWLARPSMRPQQDAEYMAAVESGDVAKQQAMVGDTYSKFVRNTVMLGDKFYPATFIRFGKPPINAEGSQVGSTGFDGGVREKGVSVIGTWYDSVRGKYVIPTGSEQAVAGVSDLVLQNRPVFVVSGSVSEDMGSDTEPLMEPGTVRIGKQLGYSDLVEENNPDFTLDGEQYDSGEEGTKNAYTGGKERWWKSKGTPLPSLAPVTRDAEGNVIPLSQRFNDQSNDIRFSVRPTYTSPLDQTLANTAKAVRLMRDGPPVVPVNLQKIYHKAQVGKSSAMVSLDDMFAEAKKAHPDLTEAEFGQQVQALYDDNGAYIESADSPTVMREAGEKYNVRMLGVPASYVMVLDDVPVRASLAPETTNRLNRVVEAAQTASGDITESVQTPIKDRPVHTFAQQSGEARVDAAVQIVDALEAEGTPKEELVDKLNSYELHKQLGIEKDPDMLSILMAEAMRRGAPGAFDAYEVTRERAGRALGLGAMLHNHPRYQHLFVLNGIKKEHQQQATDIAEANADIKADEIKKLDAESGRTAAQEQAETAEDAAFRAGEEALSKENKTLWQKAKDLITRIGASMQILAARKAKNAAETKPSIRGTISQADLDALNGLSDEDLMASIEKDQKALRSVLKGLTGTKEEGGATSRRVATMVNRLSEQLGVPTDITSAVEALTASQDSLRNQFEQSIVDSLTGKVRSAITPKKAPSKNLNSVIKQITRILADNLNLPKATGASESLGEKALDAFGRVRNNEQLIREAWEKAREQIRVTLAKRATEGLEGLTEEEAADIEQQMDDQLAAIASEVPAHLWARGQAFSVLRDALAETAFDDNAKIMADPEGALKAAQGKINEAVEKVGNVDPARWGSNQPYIIAAFNQLVADLQAAKAKSDTRRRAAQRAGVFSPAETETFNRLMDAARKRSGDKTPLLPENISWGKLFSSSPQSQEAKAKAMMEYMKVDPVLSNLTAAEQQELADMFAKQWGAKRTALTEAKVAAVLKRRHATEKGKEAVKGAIPKFIQAINRGELNNDVIAQEIAEKFGFQKLTDDENKKLETLAKELQQPDIPVHERRAKTDELVKIIARKTKLSVAEVLSAWWVTGVLSGWRTAFTIGMAFQNGLYEVVSKGATAIAKAHLQGRRDEGVDAAWQAVKNYYASWPRAFQQALTYVWTGDKALLANMDPAYNQYFETGRNNPQLIGWRMTQNRNPIVRRLGRFLHFFEKLLSALDLFNATTTKHAMLPIAYLLNNQVYNKARVASDTDLKYYRQKALDEWWGGEEPKTWHQQALVTRQSIDLMESVLAKYANVLEDAGYSAAQAAMTLDPEGPAGDVYRGLLGFSNKATSSSAKAVAAADKLKAEEIGKFHKFNRQLLATLYHFATHQMLNLVGLRFARFAANKLNQNLSFIPVIGLARMYEKDQAGQMKGLGIWANQAWGTMVAAAGVYIIKAIMDEPDDDKRGWGIEGSWRGLSASQIKQLMAAGRKQNTIHFGGHSFNYSNWPISAVMSSIGAMADRIKYSPEDWKKATDADKLQTAAWAAGKSFADTTALSQLSEILGNNIHSRDPVDADNKKISKILGSFAGGFIPRVFKDADLLQDGKLRKYEGWENFAKEIPVYRRYVGGPLLDIFGNQVEVSRTPWSREYQAQPEAKEYRLLGQLGSNGLWLTPADPGNRRVGRGKRSREMTDAEQKRFVTIVGNNYRDLVLKHGERLTKMPHENAKELMGKLSAAARDRAERAALVAPTTQP